MATAARTATIETAQVSELLEVAHSILKRHHDDDLARKTFVMSGYLDLSTTRRDRDYRDALKKAFADLTDAVRFHLDAEVDAAVQILAGKVQCKYGFVPAGSGVSSSAAIIEEI
jgi:hypothetical protein